MKQIDQSKLDGYRETLRQIRKDLVGEVEKNRETSKNGMNEQVSDISDDAAQSYSRQLIMDLGEQERGKLKLVDEAIQKLKEGNYGICQQCEKNIPEARLKVIPFAIYCVECLSEIEKENQQEKMNL